MNVFVKYAKEIASTRECPHCATLAWSSRTAPVQDAHGKWHHPACKTMRPPLEEARKKYGHLCFLYREPGHQRTAVCRPPTPEAAAATVQGALGAAALQSEQGLREQALRDVIDANVTYTFVGWLPATKPGVPPYYTVDHDGQICGELEPGDVFVPERAIGEVGKA